MATYKNKRYYRIIAALALVAFYALLWFGTDIKTYFSLQALQQHQLFLQCWVHEHYCLSVMLFIASYTIHGALALPATSLLIMTGGFLFGVPSGMAYSLIASCMGGSAAFFVTRSLFGRALHRKYEVQLTSFKRSFDKNSVTYLLIMRIIPVIPFFLANVLSGLALVPPSTFAWTLVVGILPSLLIYTLLGTELRTASSPQDLFSSKMLGLYTVIALLTLIPLIRAKYNRRAL